MTSSNGVIDPHSTPRIPTHMLEGCGRQNEEQSVKKTLVQDKVAKWLVEVSEPRVPKPILNRFLKMAVGGSPDPHTSEPSILTFSCPRELGYSNAFRLKTQQDESKRIKKT